METHSGTKVDLYWCEVLCTQLSKSEKITGSSSGEDSAARFTGGTLEVKRTLPSLQEQVSGNLDTVAQRNIQRRYLSRLTVLQHWDLL